MVHSNAAYFRHKNQLLFTYRKNAEWKVISSSPNPSKAKKILYDHLDQASELPLTFESISFEEAFAFALHQHELSPAQHSLASDSIYYLQVDHLFLTLNPQNRSFAFAHSRLDELRIILDMLMVKPAQNVPFGHFLVGADYHPAMSEAVYKMDPSDTTGQENWNQVVDFWQHISGKSTPELWCCYGGNWATNGTGGCPIPYSTLLKLISVLHAPHQLFEQGVILFSNEEFFYEQAYPGTAFPSPLHPYRELERLTHALLSDLDSNQATPLTTRQLRTKAVQIHKTLNWLSDYPLFERAKREILAEKRVQLTPWFDRNPPPKVQFEDEDLPYWECLQHCIGHQAVSAPGIIDHDFDPKEKWAYWDWSEGLYPQPQRWIVVHQAPNCWTLCHHEEHFIFSLLHPESGAQQPLYWVIPISVMQELCAAEQPDRAWCERQYAHFLTDWNLLPHPHLPVGTSELPTFLLQSIKMAPDSSV